MSSPDRLLELKTRIDVFEKQLRENAIQFTDAQKTIGDASPEISMTLQMSHLNNAVGIMKNLLDSYREYTKELESVAPRN